MDDGMRELIQQYQDVQSRVKGLDGALRLARHALNEVKARITYRVMDDDKYRYAYRVDFDALMKGGDNVEDQS